MELEKEYAVSFPAPSAPLYTSSLQPSTPVPDPVASLNPSQSHVDQHHTLSKTSKSSTSQWSTGLCDCCDDCNTCCLTCCCPCVSFGRIAEIVDRGSTSCGVSGTLYMLIMCVTGCSCAYSCFYRSKLRGQYLLKERPCTDYCVHCCCELCALCQEYRELKNRGFNMSIGWHANMDRKKLIPMPTPAMPPPIEAAMFR